MVAAIPLVRFGDFVEDKLEISKSFFRWMDTWQKQLNAGKMQATSASNKSVALPTGSSVQKSAESKVALSRQTIRKNTSMRTSKKKRISRMTESDKLLCNFIAQNELQRQVCLAVSEIANSVRHFSVLASDARAHARSKDGTAAGGPQHLYALSQKLQT